ncbi:MAG: hypothetical protein M3367_10820 [Acidobacteriota bacterium]|nr:hypothetical protein [Acidobacteriota bacterium]
MVFLLVADLPPEPELFDLEAELPAFDEPPFAFWELAKTFAPAPMAPVTAPPAAPETMPFATSLKTLPAVATIPLDELFDEELDLAAGFLAEDDLLAVDDFVPEDFADDFEPPLDDLLLDPDFEPAPDGLLVDDFVAVFEPVAEELFAGDDLVAAALETVILATVFEAGEAEVGFLLPADEEDLLVAEDDLLAAALPLEVDNFAEPVFDFVVAIALSLGYVKNVLKQTYERIFTRINSVCQDIF